MLGWSLSGSLRRSSFVKNVGTLSGATASAQGVALIISPILTRMYGSEAFGTLALYTATTAVLVGIAALRYDQAIVLANDDDEAANVLVLALGAVSATAGVVLLLVVILRDRYALLLGSPGLAAVAWIVPLSIMALGTLQVMSLWCIRTRAFTAVAASKLVRTTGTAGLQVLGGAWQASPGMLVAGQALGQGVAATYLAWRVLHRRMIGLVQVVRLREMRRLARRYADFPTYSVPAAVLNSLSQFLPAFMLGAFYGAPVVGFYWLAVRVYQLPSTVIGQSVRQVFLNRASELRRSQKPILRLFVRATLGMALVGLLPALPVVLGGPAIFAFAFGSEWSVSGQFARLLSVGWFFLFVNAPSVALVTVLQRQRVHMFFELILLIARAAALVAGKQFGNGAQASIGLYAATTGLGNIVLIIYFFVSVRRASKARVDDGGERTP